ncbi:hypothetical protein P8935_01620 [Telmatobacter sp. DSM 110680]|uniref:Amidohydrolase family protein n=1 Tax=Telmatobacter sp. DSM 110680 TaxID=3036704 RepID=A0AAU7DL63_9BACT
MPETVAAAAFLTSHVISQEAGKLANLLLIDGKPDQDIRDTHRITEIIYKGKILDREKLKFAHESTDFVVVGTALSQ